MIAKAQCQQFFEDRKAERRAIRKAAILREKVNQLKIMFPYAAMEHIEMVAASPYLLKTMEKAYRVKQLYIESGVPICECGTISSHAIRNGHSTLCSNCGKMQFVCF